MPFLRDFVAESTNTAVVFRKKRPKALGTFLAFFTAQGDVISMFSKFPPSLIEGLKTGRIIPYLGPGVLADVRALADGRPMPATNEELILALTGGKPLSPKLMHEFSRAAMHIEFKRGRTALTRFLDATYGSTAWTRAAIHDWLQQICPPYVIDINRDAQLLESYATRPHLLIQGCARLSGTDYRFRLFGYDGQKYVPLSSNDVPGDVPILFKPMGSPLPQPSYIASDADYVDYITELMGGFAIPSFVKRLRRGKQYLFLGMRFLRDTERMIARELIFDSAQPAGWALIDAPSEKEKRFLATLGIEIILMDSAALIDQCSPAAIP
ncbi:MAG: SIR2 family protein [Rhodocyclaceae bacterium]|nr:SIR2 family protein [Rhodocyclaceae bacterium]